MSNSNTYSYILSAVNDNVHNKLGTLNDPRRVIERAVSLIVNEVDVASLMRTVPAAPLFNIDGRYLLPEDCHSFKVVAVRRRGTSEGLRKVPSSKFKNLGENAGTNVCAVEDMEGNRTLMVNGVTGYHQTLEEFDAIGGWAASGDAGPIDFDTQVFTSGNASLRFNTLGASASAGVVNGSPTYSDMTDKKDNSSHFVNVSIPDKSKFVSLTVRWGSSVGDYWQRTLTVPEGGTLKDGLNRFRADWRGATVVGSPDASAAAPLAVLFATDGTAAADWRIDDWTLVTGSPFEVDYLTSYPWKDVNGDWKQESTEGSDVLMFDDDAVELVIVRASILASQVLREAADLAEFKMQFFGDGRSNPGLKRQYVTTHPPITMPEVGTWMDTESFDYKQGFDEGPIVHSR